MFDFEIKIAQTSDEIQAAQRLRFDVFHGENKVENQGGENYGLDYDNYDSISKHLIIIDKAKNFIVGTYRLLFSTDVNSIGFQSEKIYDINNIKKIDGALLELSRSCIHKEYRNAAVINLLWNGIAWQVKERNVKYIFGCPRLNSSEPSEVSEAFSLLKQKYYSDEQYRVYPLPGQEFKDLDEGAPIINQRQTFRRLSPLIKGYLHIGALVCGYPAIYSKFGTIVFFMLLPTEKMISPYKRHFLGNDTK